MSSNINLSQLPEPEVVEALDFEVILAALRADLLARAPNLGDALDLESEPVTKLLEAFAYRELLLRQRINDAARAVMLPYASGTDLDNLVALLGVERLTDESDERLRARANLAPETFSIAGPRLAYRAHAMSASSAIRDVAVLSPEPGWVRIVVLAEPSVSHINGVPDANLLAAVQAVVNADHVRPLCDQVEVQAADILTYQVSATLHMLPGPGHELALSTARAAVSAYALERLALGRGVARTGLIAALHAPGVERVTLTQPAADLVCSVEQAAHLTAMTLAVETMA